MIAYAQIRDRIEPMRGDKKGREAQMSFQVGARRLATETLGLQEIVIFTMPAGALSLEPYSRAFSIITGDGTRIDIDPSTWDETDNPWQKESILITKAEWQNPANGHWICLHEYNQELIKRHHSIDPKDGFMRAFTSEHGRFKPNRPPYVDTQVRAIVAYQPTGDFDEIRLSHEFEDALVEAALAHYLRLPGPDMDRNESSRCEDRYLHMASGLRGSELIGDIGFSRGSKSPHKRHWYGRFLNHDLLDY